MTEPVASSWDAEYRSGRYAGVPRPDEFSRPPPSVSVSSTRNPSAESGVIPMPQTGADALARLDIFIGDWSLRPLSTTGPADVTAPSPAAQTVRDIIEANRYLVLATADATGRPWSSPVYFAHIGYTEFFWVSSPAATHSRNIAVRPEVSMVIFDSHAAIGTGQGVYLSAVAELPGEDETGPGIEAFSRRSVAHGGAEWTAGDVRPGAGLRLYRATAGAHSILAKDGQPDHRVPVHLA